MSEESKKCSKEELFRAEVVEAFLESNDSLIKNVCQLDKLLKPLENSGIKSFGWGVVVAYDQDQNFVEARFLTNDSIGVWHWDPDLRLTKTSCTNAEEAARVIRECLLGK